MRQLITLSDAQYESAREVMQGTRIESFSEFFRFLVLYYEQNQKRPAGRPRYARETEDDANARDEDDIPMYQNPDKNTTSPYSYNDLSVWYEANAHRGLMPAREDLVLHKEWKKTHATK